MQLLNITQITWNFIFSIHTIIYIRVVGKCELISKHLIFPGPILFLTRQEEIIKLLSKTLHLLLLYFNLE